MWRTAKISFNRNFGRNSHQRQPCCERKSVLQKGWRGKSRECCPHYLCFRVTAREMD